MMKILLISGNRKSWYVCCFYERIRFVTRRFS